FDRAPTLYLTLSCYVPRRDLHSFPTRRSSDLGDAASTSPTPAATTWRSSPSRTAAGPRVSSLGTARGSSEGARPGRVHVWWYFRSEEHTSELQSRENLVCRLLLEKKKKKQCTK